MLEMIRRGRKEGFSIRSILYPALTLILLLNLLIVADTLLVNYLDEWIADTHHLEDTLTALLRSLEVSPELLTDSAMLYVQSGDTAYLDAYVLHSESAEAALTELNAAVTTAGVSQNDVETLGELFTALRETECSAVRSTTWGELSDYPLFQSYGQQVSGDPADLLRDTVYVQNGEQLTELAQRIQLRLDVSTDRSMGSAESLRTFFRQVQWALNGAIVATMLALCYILAQLLLRPMGKAIGRVEAGETLPEREGTLEMRHLARSYNRLLMSQNRTAGCLRSQSRTDALTGLPNRLAFEEYMSRLRSEQPEVSVTVFSLDVNGLKQVNDTLGHAYGDELLRKASACILEVFSDKSGKNCFRFGGDEFAAFWVDTPSGEIEPTLRRFEHAQHCRDVSIAVGWAFTPCLGDASVDELYLQADEAMYQCKAKQKKGLPLR